MFTKWNPPIYGQKHFDNVFQAPKIDWPTSKNTAEKKETCQFNSQTGSYLGVKSSQDPSQLPDRVMMKAAEVY
jgi:hypothetical protein